MSPKKNGSKNIASENGMKKSLSSLSLSVLSRFSEQTKKPQQLDEDFMKLQEFDTQKKCVTNLAATVVRQDNKIRELTEYVRKLESISGCSSDAESPKRCQESICSDGLSSLSNSSSHYAASESAFSRHSDTTVVVKPTNHFLKAVSEAERAMKAALMESKDIMQKLEEKHERRRMRRNDHYYRGPLQNSSQPMTQFSNRLAGNAQNMSIYNSL